MAKEYYPPVGFYFVVGFGTTNSKKDGRFQEVTGITMEMGTETVTEGGEMRFQWQLPSVSKPSNLVLKRGVLTQKSALVTWIQETLSTGLQSPIETKTIHVSLLNEEGQPLIKWSFHNARPVKWQFSGLDSMKNEILTESIEFAYSFFDTQYSGQNKKQ